VPFVVSELITGESLRSVIDRGPVARRTALELALQLARGVAAAHAQGVVHRDLKPGNLIVTADGTLKILDFGLAKVAGDRELDATEPGTLLGTAGYLSPEQARGELADARSDLFAIGAILHELLTGRRAFQGASFAERLSAVLRDTPPSIEDPIGPIVLRCLEKDPRKRFQSAHDLAWVLEGELQSKAPATRTPPPRAMVSRRAFLLGAAATGIGGAVLGRALAPVRRPFHPEYQQLSFRQGRVASARFTPDGASIVYSAVWDELPMTVYTTRLGGGGTRPLALPSAQILAVSSRGELALSLNHRFIEGFHQRGQLALAPLEGVEPAKATGATVAGPGGLGVVVRGRPDRRLWSDCRSAAPPLAARARPHACGPHRRGRVRCRRREPGRPHIGNGRGGPAAGGRRRGQRGTPRRARHVRGRVGVRLVRRGRRGVRAQQVATAHRPTRQRDHGGFDGRVRDLAPAAGAPRGRCRGRERAWRRVRLQLWPGALAALHHDHGGSRVLRPPADGQCASVHNGTQRCHADQRRPFRSRRCRPALPRQDPWSGSPPVTPSNQDLLEKDPKLLT
jgi:hypothetical protein